MGKTLTEVEKVQRAARKIEAARREELGPLFAQQAEPVDERRLLIERRLGWAKMAEHQNERHDSNHILNALYAGQLESLARQHIPAHVADRLAGAIRPLSPELQVSSWLGVLRGDRRVLSFKEVPGPTRAGLRLMVEAEVWPPEGQTPPFTKAETDVMFWRKCKACGWHAPGQTACGPPLRDDEDEILAAIKAATGKGE